MIVFAVRVRLPKLDHRVRHARACRIEHLNRQPNVLALRIGSGESPRVFPMYESQMKKGPYGLRARRHKIFSIAFHRLFSNGVASRPRSTMSQRYASAHSGRVFSKSKLEISRSRAFSSGIDCMIGSWGKSGSFGKYICVTRRERNDVP